MTRLDVWGALQGSGLTVRKEAKSSTAVELCVKMNIERQGAMVSYSHLPMKGVIFLLDSELRAGMAGSVSLTKKGKGNVDGMEEENWLTGGGESG